MNCGLHDLAVTKGRGRSSGKLVRCIEFVGRYTFQCDKTRDNVWLCDTLGQTLFFKDGGSRCGHVFIWDGYLRPIRDQPGQDEVLRLVGLPNQPEKGATVLIDLQL